MRTPAERYLEKNIPDYVERARKLSACVFQRGLELPYSGIQVQAGIFISPGNQLTIIDPREINKVLGSGRRVGKMEADMSLDGSRLAIEVPFYSNSGTLIFSWIYKAPYDLAISRHHSDEEGNPGKTGVDWINSSARNYPINMVMPAYSFHTNLSGAAGYDVRAYFYKKDDLGKRMAKYSGGVGVLNTPPAYFKDLAAPPFNKEDIKLLKKGPAEYHVNKIERMLAAMAMVAG